MSNVIDAILGFMLFLILALLLYTVYLYSSTSELKEASLQPSSENISLPSISSEANQFYQNMRFNHNNITYKFQESCTQKNKEKIKEAFTFLETKTGRVLNFREIKTNADIDII